MLLVLAEAPGLPMIVLAAMTSLAMTPYEPAVAAVTPQIVAEEELAAANSIRGVIENIVQVSGPALGRAAPVRRAGLVRVRASTARASSSRR